MPEMNQPEEHHHCPSCEHCVSIHAVSPDGTETMCMYCRHTGRHCYADQEQISDILYHQFVDFNRAFLEEVGL